jgi:hypothetical protein
MSLNHKLFKNYIKNFIPKASELMPYATTNQIVNTYLWRKALTST